MGSNVFENLEIYLNHELGIMNHQSSAFLIFFSVTTKSSDSDYFVTDMIFLREGYNEDYVRSSMSIAGIFGDSNLDASDFASNTNRIQGRRKYGHLVTRDSKRYYRYNIITRINHGLARQDKPLPSSIPIQLTFTRASSKKGLLQIVDKSKDGTDFTFSDKVITLINPVLSCYFVESAKADMMYSKTKMYDVSLNFLDYSLRRELLMDNVSDFNLKLFEGNVINPIIE